MNRMSYKINEILVVLPYSTLQFLLLVKSVVSMCKLVKSFCTSELLSNIESLALLHLCSSELVTKVHVQLSCNNWNPFETADCLACKTVVYGGTNFCFVVTEEWDLSVHSLKLYKKCLALGFSKWHDTLHPFRAFDIPNCFCLIDDLARGAMNSQVTWSEKQSFSLLQDILPVKLLVEKVCITILLASSSSVSLFPFPCWYMSFFFFFKLCCSECL